MLATANPGGEWEGTNLDTGGFVQLVRFHVHDITRLTIDTPRMFSVRMFCLEKEKIEDKRNIIRKGREETHAKRCKGADCVPTRILHERARDHLQRIRDSTEGSRLDTSHRTRTRVQAN
jgi:hypothetical protein